jgi:hypothetical protein
MPPDDLPSIDAAPADLSHAGAVVDKAIEFMTGQNITGIAIASALLGGALGMLSRTLDNDSIVRVLSNAIESVRSGEFRGQDEPDDEHELPQGVPSQDNTPRGGHT